MSEGTVQFITMMTASFALVSAALALVLRGRRRGRSRWRVLIVSALVVCGGMLWGRLGAQGGMPWLLYLLPPMGATLVVPPLALRMSRGETLAWLAVAVLAGPLVHVTFSLLLGWGQFMPPWHVPSLRELMG